MFKKFVFLFLLGTVLVTGCKKDEPAKPTDENADKIVGEWTMTAASCDDGVSTSTINGSSISSTFTWVAKDIDAKVVFKDDHTLDSHGSYTITSITQTNGQEITSVTPSGDYQFFGTWNLDGDVLETKNDGDDETAKGKILVLDDHNLKTEIKATKTRTENGIIQVSTQTVVATYTR